MKKLKKNKYQDGGSIDNTGMTGMMKSKIAWEDAFENPAAKRMVSPNPKTGITPDGIGTHYMGSYGNYAIPQLQDTGKEYLEYMGERPPLNEAFKFNRPKDAKYFAEHYKEVAPMMRNNFKTGGVIEDNMGQYNHPGKVTKINSNKITMKGINYPVLGISNTGHKQMMYPNQEYQFDGNSVTEYPIMNNELYQAMMGGIMTHDKVQKPVIQNDGYLPKAQDGTLVDKEEIAFDPMEEGLPSRLFLPYNPIQIPKQKGLPKSPSLNELAIQNRPEEIQMNEKSFDISNSLFYANLGLNAISQLSNNTRAEKAMTNNSLNLQEDYKNKYLRYGANVGGDTGYMYEDGGMYEEMELTDKQIEEMRKKGIQVDILG